MRLDVFGWYRLGRALCQFASLLTCAVIGIREPVEPRDVRRRCDDMDLRVLACMSPNNRLEKLVRDGCCRNDDHTTGHGLECISAPFHDHPVERLQRLVL